MRSWTVPLGMAFSLGLASAFGLQYLRPELFPVERGLPVTLAYLGQFAMLGTVLRRRRSEDLNLKISQQ